MIRRTLPTMIVLLVALAACKVRTGGPGAPAARVAATGTAGAAGAAAGAARPTPRLAVENVVTADGALVLPVPPQPLSFPSGGLLTELNVVDGQQVHSGDVLARLDEASAGLALAQARASLAQAQAALAKRERGDELATARLEVERAKNQLWGQQAQRDATCGAAENKMATQAACDQAQAAVQAAEQSVQLAQQSLDTAAANQPGDLASARAQVEQSRVGLQQAQRDRDNTALVAPFDGVASDLKVAQGIRVGPGSPVLTLSKTSPLRFVTTNLGERNVGDIEPGATATVTLNSFPDRPLTATVRRVAQQANTDEAGATLFAVYLDVDTGDLPVRAGMTGRAEIHILSP
jgi:membrane fusion protein (multidrug efflux system)